MQQTTHQHLGDRPCITHKICAADNKAIILYTLQLGLKYTNLATYYLTSLNRGNTNPNNFGNRSSNTYKYTIPPGLGQARLTTLSDRLAQDWKSEDCREKVTLTHTLEDRLIYTSFAVPYHIRLLPTHTRRTKHLHALTIGTQSFTPNSKAIDYF